MHVTGLQCVCHRAAHQGGVVCPGPHACAAGAPAEEIAALEQQLLSTSQDEVSALEATRANQEMAAREASAVSTAALQTQLEAAASGEPKASRFLDQ